MARRSLKQTAKRYNIFFITLVVTAAVVVVKYLLHLSGLELIEQTALHNGVISSTIFVIGFLLTATIADYKESERIPAEFASTVENMYEDARTLHASYPKFDLDAFRVGLLDILKAFRTGTRTNRHEARNEINDLNATFAAMEATGIPANFIVKLKTQQSQLLRSLFRINYIQKIRFIPSAFILVRTLVVMIILLMVLTNIEPFFGGLVIAGIISFILVYMTILIQTVSVPFHGKGKTMDDVSLFLLREVRTHLTQVEGVKKTKNKT